MSDNVIIFGAGASFDAGIPLMAGFVEKMWEFAVREEVNGKPMSDDDKKIFKNAIKIKNQLDTYHGRALFDDRNLEDILSILSFNEMQGSKVNKDSLSWFIKAISRTIELTCRIKHDGENRIQRWTGAVTSYQQFWSSLFSRYKKRKEMPTMISFNYDLVLERALFQTLISTNWGEYSYSFRGIEIDYNYDPIGNLQFVIEDTEYDLSDVPYEGGIKPGTKLERGTQENPLHIEILKLHGSLNFPRRKSKELSRVTQPVENPFILPPIINKMSAAKSIEKIWSTALQRLRVAKNVIIVGYSLPRTDIYMQYFLKTALGPNCDLNRIFVFDPVLFRDDETSRDMVARYAGCFSPQLQNRIIFKPSRIGSGEAKKGSFMHFLEMINRGMLF